MLDPDLITIVNLLHRDLVGGLEEFRQQALRGRMGRYTMLFFLLYRPEDPTQPSAMRLLVDIAPRLAQQLTRTTAPRRVLLRDHARSKVDWPATYKARASEGATPALFVCQERERRFDRAENQLLRWLLLQVEACIELAPPEAGRLRLAGTTRPVSRYLTELRYRVRQINAHVAVRDIVPPRAVEPRHEIAAREARNPLYAEMAQVYRLYCDVVVAPVPQRWREVVYAALPES
jgi:hypothetical protein